MHYRRRIPNSFSNTIFNRHHTIIDRGEVDGEKSNTYFFLPSITDRSKEINKYLNNVSISPTDVSQQQLNMWAGTSFDPSKLDLYGPDEKLITNVVEECLRHINDVSNSNTVCNADGLLS